ncbi:MAG: hypothetical protein K9K32_00970 [Halanaerobiales bacterium]|nr:hypothetical protein [Halanaerobiales bacterium]MCF8008308.1 hypothetical protein [Halanaerobiales bacterium]
MDIEFHYFVIYLTAISTGFSNNKAEVIAYSSQQVDDNCEQITINLNQQDEYENYISQTKNILKPEYDLLRIYSCFHFLPGDYDTNKAYRKDGLMHILNTTPNSKNAKQLMTKALETESLFRLGIASHTYADSWAHQNFTGTYSIFNSMEGLVKSATPNIGHSNALHLPDKVGLSWTDSRLVDENQEIDNNKRFIEALKNIYDYFVKFNNKDISYDLKQGFIEKIKEIFNIGGSSTYYFKKRKELYNKLAIQLSGSKIPDYNKYNWFNRAIDLNEEINLFHSGVYIGNSSYRWKKDFIKDTNIYNFYKAVKEHQKDSLKIINKGVYEDIDIKRW